MSTLLQQYGQSDREQIDNVVLTLDNRIIEHFSRNLYESPHKAIEELVVNGFDAFARHVHVYTPGPYTRDKVLVWDDGSSMDVEGLKQLWWIAKSPKDRERRTVSRDSVERQVIGKFGIGKLASYSVGTQISHLCKHDDAYYLVTVDYGKIDPTAAAGRAESPPVTPIQEPIYRLKRENAHRLVESLFDSPPPSMQEMLEASTWTLAVVDKLRKPDLPEGRLLWILGNGMPLRPDFVVTVNHKLVHSKLEKQSQLSWDLGSGPVVKAIKAHWSGLESGRVDNITFGKESGLDPANPAEVVSFVEFPHLGKAWGSIRIFDKSLMQYRSTDHGRSHGFFLMVLGRLINPENDKLYLREPSFQTFYRSQFIIHADKLDGDLLADRQRLRGDVASIKELRELQTALMGITRVTVEKRDADRDRSASTESRLPIKSRLYYRAPLNALLQRMSFPPELPVNLSNPKVDRQPRGVDKHIAELSREDGTFYVNVLHPYYQVVQRAAGESKAGRELLRTLDLLAVSEKLLEGYLYDIGLSPEYVDNVVEWRDGLLRRLAASYEKSEDVLGEMIRASHVGGAGFEKAIANVFEDMGFRVRRDGGSGEVDILVLATVGEESYSLAIEAKGSGKPVGNREATVAQVARHRDAVKADHGVIVARRFAGFARETGGEAAVIGECKTVGRVSILETEAIAALHSAVVSFGYPLSLLKDVVCRLESPKDKIRRIERLQRPEKDFDYHGVLQEIWRRQGDEAEGQSVPYLSVYQQGGWKRRGMDISDFGRRLHALETLAAGRIVLNALPKEICLRQSPETIIDQIEKSLRGEGHDVDDDENIPE